MLLDRKRLYFFIISAAVLSVAILAYYLWLSSTSQLSESGQPTILGHTSYVEVVDPVRFLVVEGVVQNNLDANAKVNVTATFTDVYNATFRVLRSPTALKVLKPGQKSPFTFYCPTNLSEVKYGLDLTYVSTSEQPFDALEFADLKNQTENSLFVVSGEIWNKKALEAFNVAVVCAHYDNEGDFAGLSRAFISSIEADGKVPFEIKIETSESAVDYDLMAYAGGYEHLSNANTYLFILLVLAFLALIIVMKRRGW